MSRNVIICIPKAVSGQDSAVSERRYPVLYLIHGINGYEGAWQKQGGAIDTLLQKIELGLCEPMVLVMPDCNKWPYKVHPGGKNLCRYLFRYGRVSREHEIEYSISELMAMVDTTYSVSSRCAIAGLSDGARIAANVANLRSDCVRSVGLFSPVLHKEQLPKDSTQTYYIYVGTKDIFAASGKRFHRRMKHAGYPHRFIELPGGHNWRMWRMCLSDFLESEALPHAR